MPELLSNQTVVITGGSSGIGRSIALLFAEEGANVIIPDIRETPKDGGMSTTQLINNQSDREAVFLEVDLTDADASEIILDAADEFGGTDVLVNNAAIFSPKDYFSEKPSDYEKLMSVNVESVYFLTQKVSKEMMNSDRSGSIINLSSIAGILGVGNYISYCISKGAIKMFTYALAHRLGPEGIRVNAIHPGSIKTKIVDDSDDEAVERTKKLIPSRRMGQPEEVAKTALFLASDLSSYVNGESILVDGGYGNTGSPRWDVR